MTLLAGAAALALSLGVATPSQAADDDIVIGFAIALSGWMNQYDGPPSRSAKMAINDINEAGGVLGGRNFTFTQSDTKSEAAEGARAGQEVIADGANFMI
ncbi:MAG: ABC transporter substrate-binding protein, partial [Rhodospirillales bacterium]|nr:ABC transporter substrate-binding protein [Rhodospirillales bacterium]